MFMDAFIIITNIHNTNHWFECLVGKILKTINFNFQGLMLTLFNLKVISV